MSVHDVEINTLQVLPDDLRQSEIADWLFFDGRHSTLATMARRRARVRASSHFFTALSSKPTERTPNFRGAGNVFARTILFKVARDNPVTCCNFLNPKMYKLAS